MTRFASRLLAATILTASALAAAAPASAQRVERIVAIGDSYLDDGNVFQLTGQPVPAIYPLGRFSNGTNLVDTLSQLLGVPVLNYGIGGAVARASNTTLPQVQVLDVQVQSFLAGGGPAAFPRSDGKFAPSDLLVVNIGANDARFYERSLGLNPTAAQLATLQAGAPAQAQLAAADAVRNLNALVAAGARNLTVLGGDVGILPEVRGLPIASVGSTYSNVFNTQLRTALAGYAANGAIVNYVDLTVLGQQVEKNPVAFGLRSAGAATPADVQAGRSDEFLFYVDNVHLTQAGFAVVGRYAARQLEAPLQLEAQAETVMLSAEGLGETLESRLDLASADEGHDGRGLRLFIGGDFAQRSVEDTATSLRNQSERAGGHVGVEYGAGSFTLGALIGWSRTDTEFGTGTGSIEADSLHGGGYAVWSNGNLFLEGYGGIGKVDLGIRRTAVIDEITADPEANTAVAGIQAGYLFNVGALKIGPVIGLNYARADIDAFTETGDPVLTLNVEEQEDDVTTGTLGIEVNGNFDLGGARVTPFLVARAERELESEARTIRYAGTTAPNIVNNWTVGGDEEETYGRLAVGANFTIAETVTLQVAGSTTIDREHGDNSSASVALRVGF